MRFIPILFVLSCSLCLAQQGSDKERASRMFFPPETKESIDSTKQASGPRRENSPSETIDMFFLGLKAGQIDAAYDGLVKGSVIADRREDVANLKDRTRHALDEFGPISGYELLEEKTVGSTLLRRTCISFNSDLPLRWRFYFYKAQGTWKLVDLRIDDGSGGAFRGKYPPTKMINRFLSFIRFSHTIFALPFALGSMFVAAHGLPSFRLFSLVRPRDGLRANGGDDVQSSR